MPVVTISRQFGAGGHTLGKTISERLGYLLVDRAIVEKIADEANVSVKWVEAVEREAGGLVMRLVNSLVSTNFIERLLGERGSDFDEKKYIRFLTRIIHDLAEDGDVVIVGRGAQFILPRQENIVKILLVAELEDRVKFMMKNYNMTRPSAEDLVRREEKRRAAFLKTFHPGNPDDPSQYTMVINSSRMSLKEAEDLITEYLGDILDMYARPIW